MPTYEYACSACGHEFEREQRISEDPIKKCPKCGKQKAKRLISRTSFVLKGGGWYSDLYGSAKPAAEAKPEAGKEAAGSDAGAGKSDVKPAEAKADAKPEKKKGKGKAAA